MTSPHERRTDVGEHTDVIAMEDALVQLQAERLSAMRSTLYRWAQHWARQGKPFALLDDQGRRWLTKEDVAEARKRLIPKQEPADVL